MTGTLLYMSCHLTVTHAKDIMVPISYILKNAVSEGKLVMVYKVIKWCSQDSDPECYIPKSALLLDTRHLS